MHCGVSAEIKKHCLENPRSALSAESQPQHNAARPNGIKPIWPIGIGQGRGRAWARDWYQKAAVS